VRASYDGKIKTLLAAADKHIQEAGKEPYLGSGEEDEWSP